MSVNKYKPHVFLIPEDDANRQLAVGFLDHEAVADRVVDMRDPAGGWSKVLDIFESEYLKLLRGNENAHVVMLIDFDKKVEDRKVQVQQKIPDDVSSRVFVVGSKDEPESLKGELGMAFERIGRELADDCLKDDFELWRHPHLIHNSDEWQRMVHAVKPILFQ
jgi:hypothetical protein